MPAEMIPILCPACDKPSKVSVAKGTSSYFDPHFSCSCGNKKPLYWSANKEKNVKRSEAKPVRKNANRRTSR